MNKLYCILLCGIISWVTVDAQSLPPDVQELKEQYEKTLLSLDHKYTASKLEIYRSLVNKYAAQNDFSSAAELQKAVAYLQKRMTASELDHKDELSQVGKVPAELEKQMKTLRDEMEAKSLKERKKIDKMYLDNLVKIQKKYAKLQRFNVALEIQKEITAARIEDRVAPFIGQWKTIVGTGASQNEILFLNRDFSAVLTQRGKDFPGPGYRLFRVSPEKEKSVELLGAKGKFMKMLTMDSKGDLKTPDGWKLRKISS